jgi:hypothetical protein
MNLNPTSSVAIGGSASALGVTSIMFSNNSGSAAQIDMYQASTSGSNCSGSVSTTGNYPDTFVIVPASATIQLHYPSPLVVNAIGSAASACLAFGATGALSNGVISVTVVGYANFP